MAKAKISDPAKISYFYQQNWIDIKEIIYKFLYNTRESLNNLTDGIDDTRYSSQFFSVIKTIFAYIYWLSAAFIQLMVAISLFFFMVFPHIVIATLIDITAIAIIKILALIDFLLIHICRISYVCDFCHERYNNPIYICPTCNEKHFALKPNRYGGLHHKCTCGQVLPSSFLCRKNPRHTLQSICPCCWKSGRETFIESDNSRTILIPIVGGESTGKTALITAYVKDLVSIRTPQHGLSVEFYNDDKQSMFNNMDSDYKRETVQKTATITNTSASSVLAMSLYVYGKNLNPKRLIQLYDIAGETFVSQQEHEKQNQYARCDGIVLVIDPMSLPQAKSMWSENLATGDLGTISSAKLEDVMSALNNNLRTITNIDRKNKLSTPIAIVINKIDESKDLQSRIGDEAIARLHALDPEKWNDEYDTMDFLCRQFLVDMDMPEIVDIIAQNFKTSRFFAVSAIGHTAGIGKSFAPKNVNTAIDWIIRQSDPTLANSLQAATFSKNTLPIETPAVGMADQLLN